MADGDPQLSMQKGPFLHCPSPRGRLSAGGLFPSVSSVILLPVLDLWLRFLRFRFAYAAGLPASLFGLQLISEEAALPLPSPGPSLSVSLSDMHCSSAHHQHETKSLLGGLCKPRILSFHCPQILSICSSRQMEDLALGLPGGAVRIC